MEIFKEKKINNFLFERYFDKNIDENELVWHRDKELRIIIPICENDWSFQTDNELPISLEENKPIIIEAEKFHRILKGTTDLSLEIIKVDKNTINESQNIAKHIIEGVGKDSRTKKGIKVPGKYLTAKSSKKRSQMKKEIDKFANKDHKDPKAYTKQWVADKGQKTKKSNATKAYEKMFKESSEKIKNKKEKLKSDLKKFKLAAKRESRETYLAFEILMNILKRKEVSENELKFLKEQSKDLTKILLLLSLGSISSILPIALEKMLKKSKYNISILPKDNEHLLKESNTSDKALKNKSKDSKIPFYILKQVYNRGMAAWRKGHRPGSSQNQWAMGRVNSFITGEGGSRESDKDLWKKAKKAKSKK
jgi:hypothetical protein